MIPSYRNMAERNRTPCCGRSPGADQVSSQMSLKHRVLTSLHNNCVYTCDILSLFFSPTEMLFNNSERVKEYILLFALSVYVVEVKRLELLLQVLALVVGTFQTPTLTVNSAPLYQ